MKLSIKRLAPAALLVAAVAVVPAQAHKPEGAGSHGQEVKAHGHGGEHGKSHKCKPHRVGWTVGGTLVSQTLTANGDGTYSGDVVVQVAHANRWARDEKAGDQPKTYTLTNVSAVFGVSDQEPADGTVDLTDVVAGDRVKLIGKTTTLAKKCDASEFTATTTVRKVVFVDPASAEDAED